MRNLTTSEVSTTESVSSEMAYPKCGKCQRAVDNCYCGPDLKDSKQGSVEEDISTSL